MVINNLEKNNINNCRLGCFMVWANQQNVQSQEILAWPPTSIFIVKKNVSKWKDQKIRKSTVFKQMIRNGKKKREILKTAQRWSKASSCCSPLHSLTLLLDVLSPPAGNSCQNGLVPALVRPNVSAVPPSLGMKHFLPFPLDTAAAVRLFPGFNAVSLCLFFF